LKSIDYNVAMTFILNNNNNNTAVYWEPLKSSTLRVYHIGSNYQKKASACK